MKSDTTDNPVKSGAMRRAARPGPRHRLATRWKNADTDQRRELIIESALTLLARHGLKAVTMRRVAQRLGVGAMTLYTYLDGQRDLHREMVRRGFAMLHTSCDAFGQGGTLTDWRAGAQRYLQFATQNPNLYKLMFNTSMARDDEDILRGGYQNLLDKVLQQFAEQQGLRGKELQSQARAAAGRFWIALHGLAMIAISGRLILLEGDLDQVLDDLIPRVAPSTSEA